VLYRNNSRSGASLVEFAIVGPITFIIILAIVIVGLGVFRYQEVAHLARQAARYASVHGKQYAKDTGQPAATQQSIYSNVIQPGLVILDPNYLTYSVTWNTDNGQYHAATQNNKDIFTTNTVTVTVTYQWAAQPFFSSPITLQSTATMPMSY